MSGPSLVPLVRQMLASPNAEPAMRRQVLALARQNLHQPGMAEALVDSLAALRDSETRQTVLGMVSALDTTRFASVAGLYGALLAALEREEEREVRAVLIARLAEGIGQDARIAPALAARLARPGLDDSEAAALVEAISRLPRVDEPTALALLAAVAGRNAATQAWAVALICRRPELPPAVAAALAGFLDPRSPADLRLTVLRRLHDARKVPAQAVPVLTSILAADSDAGARGAALDLLALLPADPTADAALAAAAAQDADPALRARATAALSGRAQALPPAELAHRLTAEPDPAVRRRLLAALRPHLREPAIRSAVAAAFSAAPAGLAAEETDLYLAMLTPYASREPALRDALFAACRAAPHPDGRTRILAALIPALRVADIADQLATLFAAESDPGLRATIFTQLRPLSVARHPALLAAWCGELVEPSSPFRLECAGALAASIEECPPAQAACAEVLLHDTDRALVRACLDAYLRPRVVRQAAPLLAVVESEQLETATRQRALEAVVKLPLDDGDQQRLAAILAGPGGATLKRT